MNYFLCIATYLKYLSHFAEYWLQWPSPQLITKLSSLVFQVADLAMILTSISFGEYIVRDFLSSV